MTASNLPAYTPPQPKPRDPNEKKKELTIRCLLFFDGTLNNKKNIEGRLDYEQGKKTEASVAYKDHRQNPNKEALVKQGVPGIDLEEDSYENDFSNIVSLETNIALQQSGFSDTVIVYTEGAGTENYNRDEKAGYAFAAGDTGIKTKVQKGIDDALQQIGKGPKGKREPEKFIIKKLTFDLFGFSRGAASARYCVHRLLQREDILVDVDLDAEAAVYQTQMYIKRRLRMHGFEVGEVEVCFVGLFDTVSSYYATHLVKLLPLENWLVKLNAVKQAQKVVQLAAAEEHRYHFCLHNIKSVGPKGEQYFLPGTHSDVGGGYLDEGTDANLIVFQGSPDKAVQDRNDYLLAHGWYQKDQLVEDILNYHYSETGEELYPSQVQLRVVKKDENPPVEPRVVRNAYCKIPLKIMAEKAGKSGINVLPDLENDATATINVFPELTKLETEIKNYMTRVGPRGSQSSDWLENAPAYLKTIRHKHLHFSARYNTYFGYNPRRAFLGGQRKRFEFDG